MKRRSENYAPPCDRGQPEFFGRAFLPRRRLGGNWVASTKRARCEAREGLSIDPMFTIRRYRSDAPSDNLIFLNRRQQIYELMREIGVPEE